MLSPEIVAAMKALHFERNGPSSGHFIPWGHVPELTKRELERDARAALELANMPALGVS